MRLLKVNVNTQGEEIQRYFVNGRVAPVDMVDGVMTGIKYWLRVCGMPEDIEDTPHRFMAALAEMTSGYQIDPKSYLEVQFEVPHKELVLVRDIEFVSVCEHHLLPFFGTAHVAYVPNEAITGLSKIPRMVEGYAKRFQVQERLTTQIAEAMQETLDPQGVMVVIDATHTCMSCRGVRSIRAVTTTSAVRGCFKYESDARAEVLSLIRGK